MNTEHVISDEVLNDVMAALASGDSWFVYNRLSYFLGKEDVQFFKTENEANDWMFANNSKTETYRTIHINSVTDLYSELKYGEKLETILNHLKTFFMNAQNLDYLKENLRLMGFGDKLHADLEKNMQQGFPEFVLKMQSEFNGKNMDTPLSFKKSDQSDMYFFNRFDAHLHHRNDVSKDIQQTFFLNKGHGVTLKEAFNLLEGRAVHKELPGKEGKFNAWIQLDFKEKEENGNYKMKQFHENYGYDLEGSLKAFPIKELQNEQQSERLLMSLQKGNVQSVTMAAGGREQMFFVEANPQYKTVTVYDAHMKMLNKEQRAELVEKSSISNEKLNHKEVKPDKPEQVREIKEATSEKIQKPEITKPDKGKSKDERLSQVSSETQTSGKTKKEKTREVKNLLPQKEKTSPKKGLRV
ncbi:MAG TPA: hypothetical protein VNT20_21510 [Flavisolibacter sp.]|jgi:hypothetical protein|nr:hypothetical protein [Flavisolibacter sp.]